MKLYLIRHAESESNASRTLQSHDSQLSTSGVEQTKLLSERFADTPVNLVITSPFPRAVQTAVRISSTHKVPLEESHLLANRKRASSLVGMSYDDPKLHEIEQAIQTHQNDPDWHFADEENTHEFLERIKQFISELEKRKEEHVVVVTHAIVVRGIVAAMLFGDALTVDLHDRFHDHTWVMNTGITVCETYNSRWVLERWNDSAHLPT